MTNIKEGTDSNCTLGGLILSEPFNFSVPPSKRVKNAEMYLKSADAMKRGKDITLPHIEFAKFEREIVRALLHAQSNEVSQDEFSATLEELQRLVDSRNDVYNRHIASAISAFFVLSVAIELGFKIVEPSVEEDVRSGIDYIFIRKEDIFYVDLKNYSQGVLPQRIKTHNQQHSNVGFTIGDSQQSAIQRAKESNGYSAILLFDYDSHYWLVTPSLDPAVVANLFDTRTRGPKSNTCTRIERMLNDEENLVIYS